MIIRLKNKELSIAEQIRVVFQASYTVEAKLLNAVNFPPLSRPLDNFMESENEFFGYTINQELAAVVEIHHIEGFTHIQSLVVHPKYFRQGIGTALMEFVLKTFNTKPLMVETGAGNGPAIALYKKFNFVEVHQWDTNIGIRKVRFVQAINKE